MAVIQGTNKNDVLIGTTADDSIFGLAGNDTLNGGAGSDTLDGGLGSDTFKGEKGNDTYIVNSNTDIVTESTNSGTDTVRSSVSYTLASDLEKLTLTGTNTINGTGNNLNNTIIGNAANNILSAGAGNDTLSGGAGNDTLDGGAGNDTADYNGLQAITLLPQGKISAGSLGTDSITKIERIVGAKAKLNVIDASSAAGKASMTVNLAANSLIIKGIPGLDKISFTVENFVNITGTPNADTMIGNSGNNVLIGKAGNDTLFSNAGNDLLAGEKGSDTLTGGDGADTFAFNFPTEGIDTISDFKSEQGDKIQVSASGFGISQGQYSNFSFQETATEGAVFFQGTLFASLQLGSGFSPSLDITIV